MDNKLKAVLLFAAVCLLSAAFYFLTPATPAGRIGSQGFFLLIIPIFIAYKLGLKGKDIGLSFKHKRRIILYSIGLILLATPIMLYACQLPVFQMYYPRFAALTISDFVIGEMLVFPLFLFQEFFFRGFALFQLKKYVGDYAIVLSAIPYTLVHIGKPMPEVYFSFFAALVFGYVCLKSKSFLPAFIPHYVSSVIFDVLCW
ncbi:MAG: CPBP family intramembrane glutamic endopeptidase [archaeon]